MFAYEQCLLYLATHPDIYYEATSYLQQMSILMAEKCDAVMGRHYANEAVNLYERAISTFMKHNMLIYFAYCDFEESRLNYTKVNEIYEKILKIEEIDPSLVLRVY
jgi:cleavage stimulation factor subunit 3